MTAGGARGEPAPLERAFLFTDLADHSALWDADPAATAEVLAQHDRLLSEVVAAAGGTVVKSTGDGIMAVFEHAATAVAAARAVQEQVAATPWSVGPVLVRAGVHVGPAFERDGDWFGPAVGLAARLCDSANGGQVVASDPVAHLVRDERWVDLGEHRFRGVSAPERVHQLLVGDRVEFPALRRIEQGTDRLPHPSSTFVGREGELAALVDALRAERLVTLTAIGGGGKTRLAIEAGRALLPELADAADFVDLAPVGSDDAVPAAVASALRLDRDDSDRRSPTSRVLAHCRARQLLLVVDNCEHLLDGVAAMVEALLDGCPDLRVLATSREPLHLPGERVVAVPSMATPAAVELFLARAASAGGAVEPRDLPTVQEVCVRLDGIPLAIELAAARTPHLAVPELAARLDDRFRLLTGGNRRLQRQQTLQATLDWTHDQLGPDEQALLRRLAVFAGWFRLDRVESLWGAEVLDLLASLVERSMVVHDRRSGRYRLLETVRLYAELQLLAAGEADEWRTRHRDVFAAVVSAPPLEELVHISDTARTLVDEHADLRAALRWSIDAGDWSTAATIGHRLPAVFHLAGDLDLPALLAEVFPHLDRESEILFLCALAAVVANEARSETVGMDVEVAAADADVPRRLRTVAEMGRARGDDRGLFAQAAAGLDLVGLGIGSGRIELAAEGRALIADAVERVDDGDTSLWTSYVLGVGGLIWAGTGRLDEGVALLRRAAGVDGGHRNDEYLAIYALVLLVSADPAGLEHAWAARGRVGYGFARVSVLATIAIGEAGRGNVGLALEELRTSLPDYERYGDGPRGGFVLAAAGVVRIQGDPELAARWLGGSESVGVERGPHMAYATRWQASLLDEDLPPDVFEAARATGRAAGIDGCFAEVAAWLDEGRAT